MTRTFDTGATRDADDNKYDYEAFLSPLVIEAYGRYMHKKRQMPDGTRRPGDNWQLGIPLAQYMKSWWRHFKEIWTLHRGYPAFDERGEPVSMEDALMANLFNNMGYAHEYLKQQRSGTGSAKPPGEPEYVVKALTGPHIPAYERPQPWGVTH